MEVIYNQSGFHIHELVRFAQRENNTKRSYLFVNPLQAKHLPANPVTTLQLFQKLGSIARNRFTEKQVAVIGFAETATAIGATVAKSFGGQALLLQTTREHLPQARNLVQFEEEHSHAKVQKLCFVNDNSMLAAMQRVIFVEDEITTGKTILNFISALREKGYFPPAVRFAAVSLVNSMLPEHENRFAEQGVAWDCLVKVKTDSEKLLFSSKLSFDEGEDSNNQDTCFVFAVAGKQNPRTGILVEEYQKACATFVHKAREGLHELLPKRGKILVLGTEEFMYPPLLLAQLLAKENSNCKVLMHATTRSPILPSLETQYPIKRRNRLSSFYEEQRDTFVYNLEPYDLAVVMSDAPKGNQGLKDLVRALHKNGTDRIAAIYWV